MRQDLINHRRLRDTCVMNATIRIAPAHCAGAWRAHERVDLDDLLQERRPPAGDLGGRQSRRDHHRHGGLGTGGLRLAAHAAGAVGIPPRVPRGDVALGDVALGDVALGDVALGDVALGDVALGGIPPANESGL